MSLVQTITLGTAAPSITFSNIPQDATDLYVVLSWDGTSNGSFELDLQLNSTTNTLRRLFGTGTTRASQSNDQIAIMDSDFPTTNTFHSLAVYIPNYTTAAQHSFSVDAVVEANSGNSFGSFQQISAGLNSSTSAVTTLSFVADYLDFSVNSTASLYKITKA